MTELTQAGAALALVFGLAMLAAPSNRVAAMALYAQSVFTAAAAVASAQPMLALPPILASLGVWLMVTRAPAAADACPRPARPVLPVIAAGAVLSVLCASQAGFGLPLAVLLVSLLPALTRTGRPGQIIALAAMQNAIVLTGCDPGANFAAGPGAGAWLAVSCLALPLAVAGAMPVDLPHAGRLPGDAARWRPYCGLIETAALACILAATLTIPLRPLASIFAPLLAFEATLIAWSRHRDPGQAARRALSVLATGFTILAICVAEPVAMWLCLLAAAVMTLLPGARQEVPHRPRALSLAGTAAGLALFGVLTAAPDGSPVGWFALFAGLAILAATAADLAAPIGVIILGYAMQSAWPDGVNALAAAMALTGLMACGLILGLRGRSRRMAVLPLSQTALAALAIATGSPGGRFAALVLLVLLILSRTAARIAPDRSTSGIAKFGPSTPGSNASGSAAAAARAALAGLPPFGVFPGLVLALLAIGARSPWLLAPATLALLPGFRAGLPAQWQGVLPMRRVHVAAWLPLALAFLFGFFAPANLVQWLAALAAGPS